MQASIHHKHEKIFQLLRKMHESNPDFRFKLRKSNRYSRLEKGYWFYGNEHYLALSFWSGSDWKNKTPNIIFVINNEGETSLDLTALDSPTKYGFFQKTVARKIEGLVENKKYYFHRSYEEFGKDYMKSLKSFLENEKQIIDEIIQQEVETQYYFEQSYPVFNRIGFIPEEDFQTRLNNVIQYRQNLKIDQLLAPDIVLRSIKIENIKPIEKLEITDIPATAQWIFLTGMNGTGKSSILKALTAVFVENYDNASKIFKHEGFVISAFIEKSGKLHEIVCSNETKMRINDTLPTGGFAAYGATRLNQHDQYTPREEIQRKSALYYSMFHTDGLLMNVKEQLLGMLAQREKQETDLSKFALERIDQIIELLPELIPSLSGMIVPDEYSSDSEFYFIESNDEGDQFGPVLFEELASGIRSMVAMFGDMMLRLFAQQKEVSDPSELKGIVLIDEIDIHLHPSLQKKLVELLSGVFPKIQFIVSTHSPIPLLGAPKNSVIYNVTRSREKGTEVDRINVDFTNMLPNVMLTSPIFGMEEIMPESNEDVKKVITGRNYNDEAFFEIVEKRIDELAKELDK